MTSADSDTNSCQYVMNAKSNTGYISNRDQMLWYIAIIKEDGAIEKEKMFHGVKVSNNLLIQMEMNHFYYSLKEISLLRKGPLVTHCTSYTVNTRLSVFVGTYTSSDNRDWKLK